MMMQSGWKIYVEGVEYKTCGIIGQGGQGVVYLAKDINDKTYAIKMIKQYKNPFIKESVDTEIKTQKEFAGCPFVIQIIGVQIQEKRVFIVFQLGQYTLKNCIQMKRMNQFDLIFLLCDILLGLVEIHSKNILHRDIKPENIIFKEGSFKITDFGIAIDKPQDNSFVGTLLYLPPEILFENEANYTNKVDIWSLGVSAFVSFFKVHPFFFSKEEKSHKQIMEEVKKNIKLLTPNFTMDKFLNQMKKRNMTSDLKYVERRLQTTKPIIIEKLIEFFQPDPEKREDSSYFAMVFNSLKESLTTNEIPRSRIHRKFSREHLPFDLEVFCRAKDLFYELNSQIQYQKQKQAILGLELGIWFLEGKNYSGTNIILLDQIETIKNYKQKPEVLWQEVKNYLSQYYWYLKSNEENEYFNKIHEIQLYILICSVWYKLNSGNFSVKLCQRISEITKLDIVTLLDLFKCLSLYSLKNFQRIETEILEMFYYE